MIIIKSDDEFSTNAQMDYCFKSRIILEMSVPYESDQNVIVERGQRGITTKARSLLARGNVPDELWNEAVKCAAYLPILIPKKYQNAVGTLYEIFPGERVRLLI